MSNPTSDGMSEPMGGRQAADRGGEAVPEDRRESADDLHALFQSLPPEIVERLYRLPPDRELIEVIMDLGRRPEARFGGGGEEVLLEREVDEEDIQYVIDHIGSFGEDNRAARVESAASS